MKIYDIFTFNGEYDVLEIRLNILNDFVDEFIIVEAPTTFSGSPKPLYYELQKERYKKWHNKIKYFVIDENYTKEEIDLAKNSPGTVGEYHWQHEFLQKESIKKALTNLKDDDICFIGDVDEIWNENALKDLENPIKIKLEVYSYYLNNKSSEKFWGLIKCPYYLVRQNCLNVLRRDSAKTEYVGGWHFTSMGGYEEVKRKLQDSYSEKDYFSDKVKNNLKSNIQKRKDFLGRKFTYTIDESNLPKYILNNKEKYKYLFKNSDGIQIRMIITNLTGGLGNQFFQYAVGRALSKKLGVPLKCDTTWYEKSSRRKYLLNNFNISGEIASPDEIRHLKPENIFNKIMGKVFGFENKYKLNKHVWREPEYRFCPEILNLPKNTYLDGDGCYQSYKYFEDIEHIIRKEFTLKEPLPKSSDVLVKDISTSNSVSIHIRRGDYLVSKNQKIFGVCDKEYYQKAASLMKEKISNPRFFVFSDDLEWSKTLPFPKDTTYIDSHFGLADFQELVIMSGCKHNIIANSTFSWWAAWLNNNPNKIVISPKKWFNAEEMNTRDLIPETWIKI